MPTMYILNYHLKFFFSDHLSAQLSYEHKILYRNRVIYFHITCHTSVVFYYKSTLK